MTVPIHRKSASSLTSSFHKRGTLAFAIVLFAPVALASAAIYYYTLAARASVAGGFPLWDMFRLSVHDVDPNAEYRFLGLHVIAREYLYQSVFFLFFTALAGVGAANHWLLRARDRRIVAALRENGLL